jgi:hypothetical protein
MSAPMIIHAADVPTDPPTRLPLPCSQTLSGNWVKIAAVAVLYNNANVSVLPYSAVACIPIRGWMSLATDRQSHPDRLPAVCHARCPLQFEFYCPPPVLDADEGSDPNSTEYPVVDPKKNETVVDPFVPADTKPLCLKDLPAGFDAGAWVGHSRRSVHMGPSNPTRQQ